MEATIMMSPAPEILYSLLDEYVMPEQEAYGACGTMMVSFIPHSENPCWQTAPAQKIIGKGIAGPG